MHQMLQALMLAVRVGWRAARASYQWSREPVVPLEEDPEPDGLEVSEDELEYITRRSPRPEGERMMRQVFGRLAWMQWAVAQAAAYSHYWSEAAQAVPWPRCN